MTESSPLHRRVADSLERSPIIGVVRTSTFARAAEQARLLASSGVELIEITFTVPDATALVRELLAARGASGPPWFGMGTVTDRSRADRALAAGAEFLVSPNVDAEVAGASRDAGRFLVLGALTPTEIVAAARLGADIVKVYPLPPVGGPSYLATVRGPLGDIPMLAAGGFGVDEIPAYRSAGASAFGLSAPLLGVEHGAEETRKRVSLALSHARPAAVLA
jgi:2-dehydro-3-deoxyphosphogluconate aldolase/(4S)-4-hydroxy-2-oxoglutarate aldolase